MTTLIFTYQIIVPRHSWPSLSSVSSASLEVDVSRSTSRSGSKQYGQISPTGSGDKEATDEASPSPTLAEEYNKPESIESFSTSEKELDLSLSAIAHNGINSMFLLHLTSLCT